MGTLFSDSREASFRGFSLELLPAGASSRRRELEQIHGEVVQIAARSRGWTDDATLEHFRRHFKIGPLYETNALVLVRREGRLVGLAGTVNDWTVDGCSLVHLCSIGLLPEAQKRGIIPAMMGLLWELSMQIPHLRRNYEDKRVYVTAITQSPYLIGYLNKLFEIYPNPDRAPDERIRSIAGAVVRRFDPELAFEERTLVIRAEANFFYRRIPYGTDRAVNAFCDSQLRYGEGDVFVVVGRVLPERLLAHRTALQAQYGELFSSFGYQPGARPARPPEPAARGSAV